MKQWEIYDCLFDFGSHPVVVISPPARIANLELKALNVLQCGSHRAARLPRDHEVLLDREDGLDWETLVRCDMIHAAFRADLKHYRGEVTRERKRQIGRKIIQLFGLLLE